MKRVDRKVLLDDSIEYERVGVRWYGKGAFVRDNTLGADIARKQQWVLHKGDVVYNKLFAWKGAFALADETVDGRIVSDKFPTYEIDRSQVDPEYLRYFFRTHQLAFQAERLSKGAAAISKLTLNPPQFWDLTIPLPSRSEQERLVALLRQAEEHLAAAQSLRTEAEEASRALIASVIGQRLAAFSPRGSFGDVLEEKPRNGWSAYCDNAEGGTPVLSVGAVTGFKFRPTEFKRTSEPTVVGAHYWLAEGDLLMTRANTRELVGHVAFYEGEPSPCIYPDKMMRIKVQRERVEPRFAYYWLRTPTIRALLEGAATGTSSSMRNIKHEDVTGLPFPVDVDLADQRAAVAELDRLLEVVDELRSAQSTSRDDIDALMPSLLDRAFEGELHEEFGIAGL